MAPVETTSASSTLVISTITLLLLSLVVFTRAESYNGVMRLDSAAASLRPDFSLLTETLFERSIMSSAWTSALQEGIWNFSYLIISFVCGFFPLQWIRNYLDRSDYFGSNFH